MEFAVQIAGGQSRHEKTGLEAIVEESRLAEDCGFSAAFVPDHYVFEALGTLQREIPAYDPFVVLATLAQRTTRIRLGTQVACMLFRHPAMTARLFAQIDEASGGRVIAGVGAGWTKAEFDMMGIPFPPISERLRIMDEAVAVMRGLWTTDSFSFSGEHFHLKDAVALPRPVQKPYPPIMLGGSGKGILRRAGQWADIVHMVPQTGRAGTTTIEEVRRFDEEAMRRKLELVREEEQRAGRKRGSVRLGTTVYSYNRTGSSQEGRALAEQMGAMFGLPPERLRRHPVALVGTIEEIRDELARRKESLGLDLLVINFPSLQQMEEFGKHVIARL